MGFEQLSEVLSLKYSLEILALLSDSGRLRFSELDDRITASSDVLSRTLRTLCENRLVKRYETNPRNVHYSITDTGQEFLELGRHLEDILSENQSTKNRSESE